MEQCLWIENSILLIRMSILPNLIYRYNAIPIKIPANYFVDVNKLILNFIWKGKRPRTTNPVPKKEEEKEEQEEEGKGGGGEEMQEEEEKKEKKEKERKKEKRRNHVGGLNLTRFQDLF